MADARQALATEDPVDATAAVEALVDLASQTRGYDYFRSEDPIEAAKVVISDEVGRLWKRTLEHLGFATFAALAAPQLIRWESQYGWTRSGYGQVAQKETTLATVLTPMLGFHHAWTTFSNCYLQALDGCRPTPSRSRPSARDRPPWPHDRPPRGMSLTARYWSSRRVST
jgi:hypothetical protein